MADFCRQCALDMWGPDPVYGRDLAGLSSPEDTAKGLYAVVICEGCGYIQVDHEGNCVSWDCLCHHAPKPPLWDRIRAYAASQWSRPIVRRRLLLTALVAASLASLAGCAAFDAAEDWYPIPRHKPLPVHHITVPQGELAETCGWRPAFGQYIYGCALRVPEANVCVIYTGPNPAPWQLAHEEKHCAGYDHPIVGLTRYSEVK